MLDFLNEVLMIEDLEPDTYQMGISGKSGAKMKAPDGGKAGIKGDFNALHPRYPAGHPQGGKFMPKGSKDQIKAIAKNTGQSVEKVAAAVGGKAPAKAGTNMAGKIDDRNPAIPKSIREAMKGTGTKKGEGKAPAANKGKLSKFMGSAGAVGKAQKVLKNKDSTPEQRAKAKASIGKAADKMRMSKMSTGELFKESDRIMNKPIYKEGAKAPTGSMTQGAKAADKKRSQLVYGIK